LCGACDGHIPAVFHRSASQASKIFFTSVKDKHGFVRMIAPVGNLLYVFDG
jgi:hypothetical protein